MALISLKTVSVFSWKKTQKESMRYLAVMFLKTPFKKKLFGKGWGDGRGDIDYDTLQVLGEGTALAL